MAWYSPPSRREVSLVLFSLTVFVLFYNLEASFNDDGLAETGPTPANASDGSQDWDGVIYGNWTWEETQVAQNAQNLAFEAEKSTAKPVPVSFNPILFGSVGVNDGFSNWGHAVPTTTVLKHVPGYTIMDNVFMLNGTLFVVSDDPAFPPLGSVASASDDSNAVPRPTDWQVLSSDQARETLGPYGGIIQGVTWLVTDASPSNYSLFSLWRTYVALDTALLPDVLKLPPPRRVFYPNVPTFVEEQPADDGVRARSPSGFHPLLAKAAFPTLGLMYEEDWADYSLMHVPFLIRRVVVGDEGAARRGGTNLPGFAVPLLELEASKVWWEPIRRNVARFLDVAEGAPKKAWLGRTETVVTYLSRQDAADGPRLREQDHEALVEALGGLGKGFTTHVVPSEASWMERMRAIAQSTIVIGVYGTHMADCVYVPPSSRAAVMEIFPPGVFVRDLEVAVRSLDVGYFAWWEGRQHGVDSLPVAAPPPKETLAAEVPIDVSAMMQAIRRLA